MRSGSGARGGDGSSASACARVRRPGPPVGGPAARRRPSARVRRRRLAACSAVALTAALSVPLGLSGGGPLAASGQAAAEAGYTVRPGDTLWTIAEHADPGGDPRPLVEALSEELHGDRLTVGERIRLP